MTECGSSRDPGMWSMPLMPAPQDVISAAIQQVELGFAAFALQPNGKKPVTEHGFKNATTNPDWVRTQLEAPAAGNYGITWPESAPYRVVALDLDNGSEGKERPWQDRLLELIEHIGPLPATKATTTPSGGRHAFYRWPAGVPMPPGDELFGFTVRWPGRGYLVGPGSSVDGVQYLAGPVDTITALPPEWVAAAVAERRGRRSDSFVTITGGRYEVPQQIPAGRRYAAIRDFIASRYNDQLPPDELWELVRAKVAPNFTVPKVDSDLRADFDRAIAKIADRLGAPRLGGLSGASSIPAGPLEDAALTEFSSEPIEWLWPAWLPRSVVTLMDGNPGVSKSTVVADLVARITTGRAWPDDTPGTGIPARVMWITTEDDPGRVIRPRVEAAGGNASLVRYVTSEVVFPSGAGAFRELVVQRAAEAEGLALVVLDPLFSHIEAGIKTISDADMRKGVMNPLGDAAEAAGVSILVVRHFNKDAAASALNRGAGSLGGIVGAARALWSVTVDPEDETGETKAIGVSKMNYARPHMPLLYTVIDRLPPGWVTGSVSGIEWKGVAKVGISAMMTEDIAVVDAVPALQAILARGAVAAPMISGMMRGRGFGRTATNGAAKRLGVVKTKSGFGAGWSWALPEEAEEAGPEGSEEARPDSSASSSSRGRARAGGNRLPDSSDSSIETGPPSEEAEEAEEAGASRASAPAREAKGSDNPTVTCHSPHEHSTAWQRAQSGSWICTICSPEVAA